MQISKIRGGSIESGGFAPSPCTKIIFTILDVREIGNENFPILPTNPSSLVFSPSSKKKSRENLSTLCFLLLALFQYDVFQQDNHDNTHHKAVADDWSQYGRDTRHSFSRSERQNCCEHNRNTQNKTIFER